MASDQEQLETIKAHALAQLVELRANPKPSYTIGDQAVSWESYAASLERTVDWCDEKLGAGQPFEIKSRGVS